MPQEKPLKSYTDDFAAGDPGRSMRARHKVSCGIGALQEGDAMCQKGRARE